MSDRAMEVMKRRIQDAQKIDRKFADLDFSEVKIVKFGPEVSLLIQNCKHLQVLYLVNCSIQSLEVLPKCNLIGLDLSYNNIGDSSHVQNLLIYPELETLLLSHNKISKLQTILVLQNLKNLSQLDVRDNPLEKNTSNEIIFQKFLELQFFNGKDSEGNLVQFDSDLVQEGQFMSNVDSVEDDQAIFQDQQQAAHSEDNEGSQQKNSKSGKKKKSRQ